MRPISLKTSATSSLERRNPHNTREALIVEGGLPSDILRDGLCLVDTPGLGSVHATNTEATRAFVPRIVVGPDPPISGPNWNWCETVSRDVGELAVVLNKADQVSPDQLRRRSAEMSCDWERRCRSALEESD